MTLGWPLHCGMRALTPALSRRQRAPIPAAPIFLVFPLAVSTPAEPVFHPLLLGAGWGEGNRLT